MRDVRWSVAVFVLVVTALSYFVFPGHTYLQQDTQIYLPMLEKLEDPSLFARELLTSRPHLAWTLYDETAMLLRRTTGLSFATILIGEQLLFRALGVWGVLLIGTSLGFTRRLSMFLAALFSLGATIVGPAVLTVEYEPVPRGFAVPLVLLAIGLSLHRRWMAASVAASVALVYHAPTSAPFWVLFAILLWRAREWKPVLIPAAAMALLVVCSRLQPGLVERQPFFSTISPALIQLQRLRAPYNWVSLWPAAVIVHYVLLAAICTLAMWRIRARLWVNHWILFLGLIGIGLVSMPFSYVTLEHFRWSLIPQFQPARAVLFITVLGVILCGAAGAHAAYERRFQESFAWLLIPFIIPVHQLLTPPYTIGNTLLIVLLAASAAGAMIVHVTTPRRGAAALAMAGLMAFFGIPLMGGVHNYPALWNAETGQLAQWARQQSPKDSVFLFPYSGKDHRVGLFRAEARRAVYVDWKGGGQVNYFEDLAREWWDRWESTVAHTAPDAELASRGVDYVVVDWWHARSGEKPVFQNQAWLVYRVPGR